MHLSAQEVAAAAATIAAVLHTEIKNEGGAVDRQREGEI
jgi:hypothetical protein